MPSCSIFEMPIAALTEPVQRRTEHRRTLPRGDSKKLTKSLANAFDEKSTTSTNFQSLPPRFNNLAKSRKTGFNVSKFQGGKVRGGKVARKKILVLFRRWASGTSLELCHVATLPL
jgi:hypothetical protein